MSSSKDVPVFSNPLPIDRFLESDDSAYLYDDLRQFEHYFLSYLTEHDHTGSTIGLCLCSCDELVFIIAACWRLGISFVPFDPDLTDKELADQMQQAEVRTLITGRSIEAKDFGLSIIPVETFGLSKVVKPDFTPEQRVADRKKNISSKQVFGYFFTSGTTGIPKIVPLKRRQMLHAAQASSQNLKPQRNGLWLLCMPLYHIGGISVILRSLLYGSAVYRTDGFHAGRVQQLLSENPRMQAASLVPTMLKRLLNEPGFAVPDRFIAILLGGGPIDEALVDRCFTRGIPIIASYGMTETCAQIAANPLMTTGDLSRPAKSAGRIFTPNEIEIRDPDNNRADPLTSGHIWLRGPQVFDGYLNRGKKKDFDYDRWFNTGDFGYLNKNNELFIETRRTDLIISGGENIAPAEVEEALEKLSIVKEAAVTGIPDDEWGQKVVAAVTTDSGQTINAKQIQQQLAHLRSFKVPKEIVQVDHLPRSETGKLLRNKVREMIITLLSNQ